MSKPATNPPVTDVAQRAPARLRGGLAALLCLGLALPAGAAGGPPPSGPGDLADMSLEDLMDLRVQRVWSASKYEQKVSQAPASVTIVTADEIRQFGYRTLADVLRAVRGLYVTYDRDFSTLGVRGFDRPGDYNNRILLLVDGHRMNDFPFDSALIGREALLDVDLIERVEVIRGPSSSIYGSSAFLGVINVITRKGEAIAGAEVSATAGSLDTKSGRFTYGQRFADDLDLVLSGSFFDTAGERHLFYPEFDAPETHHGIATNADGEFARNFFGRLAYHGVTVSGGYSLRDKQVPTASLGTVFNAGGEKNSDERVFLDLQYERALSPAVRLMGRAFYDRFVYRATYPYGFVSPHETDYADGAGAEVQLTTRLLDRHTVLFGAEYREALNLHQSVFTDHPSTLNFLDHLKGRSLGAYSQAEIVVRPNLLVNAGLRYDHYDDSGGTVNPRLGVIYNPWTETTLKLLYGRAYRTPNAYEQYLVYPGINKANPDLRPETIATYELALEQFLSRNLRLSASGYRYEIKDLISLRRDPVDKLLVFRNVDRVRALGVELELEGRYAHGLLARVSYALQIARDDKTGRELNDSPRHLAKLNLGLPLSGDRLHAGIEFQYTSRLTTLAEHRTSGFLLANATLLCSRVLPHLEVAVSVYNLFDRAYAYPASPGLAQDVIPQDGRSWRVKGTYKF
ncbi:MAG TPA: TonB-dependent receptor [Thermoanaerobaculia bacterium]|nr:TonB-dependent receptor [Thermoanaerobaculia bacterium]